MQGSAIGRRCSTSQATTALGKSRAAGAACSSDSCTSSALSKLLGLGRDRRQHRSFLRREVGQLVLHEEPHESAVGRLGPLRGRAGEVACDDRDVMIAGQRCQSSRVCRRSSRSPVQVQNSTSASVLEMSSTRHGRRTAASAQARRWSHRWRACSSCQAMLVGAGAVDLLGVVRAGVLPCSMASRCLAGARAGRMETGGRPRVRGRCMRIRTSRSRVSSKRRLRRITARAGTGLEVRIPTLTEGRGATARTARAARPTWGGCSRPDSPRCSLRP
jgi:hypothetical protein